MNFSQLHERLRLELLRRIEREVLTASLLARKSGLQQPHISNFLRNKRRLSLPALDRVLLALELSVADLLIAPHATPSAAPPRPSDLGIPLVSHQTAMHDDRIRAASITERLHLPTGALAALRAEHGVRPPTRDRFVAVGLTPAQALPMEPRLHPNAILVLDRHSNVPSAAPTLARGIYALPFQGQLHFCYLSFQLNRLILRPHSLDFPIHLLTVPPNTAPSDLITGRVCHIFASF